MNQTIMSQKRNIVEEDLRRDSQIEENEVDGKKVFDVDEGFIEGLELKNGIPGRSDVKFRLELDGEEGVVANKLSKSAQETSFPDESEDDDEIVENVVEVKGQVYANASNGEVEVLLTCPICALRGRKEQFCGRFCSRKCVAKNANIHRNSNFNTKKDNSGFYHKMKSHSNSQDQSQLSKSGHIAIHGRREKRDDLKIRIRLLDKKHYLNDSHKMIESNERTPRRISPGGYRDSWFNWTKYVADERAEMAPTDAFQEITGKSPFPGTNKFKCGMGLEGVDPKHQSLICPLSVASILGFRIRLHFCGYSESYDFWVNADHPLLFPCGFCQRTGRKLEPPKGVADNFNWEIYMKQFNLYPAPNELFSVVNEVQNQFERLRKLEAVDKYNPDLVCVATVNDIIGDNVLIHFDGWTHDFDYWCPSSSYLIHPVGWCEKMGRNLTPPEGYSARYFSWQKYLQENNEKGIEESLFQTKSHRFKAGMKLEVVDPRNPILVRVASITQTKGFRIMIRFDGWSDLLNFWSDVESPDIHPAGWCKATNHPLHPPVRAKDIADDRGLGKCPIPQCRGIGHVKGPTFLNHHSEFGCPYSAQNLHGGFLRDRLSRPRLSSSTHKTTNNNKHSMMESDLNDAKPLPKRIRTARYSSPPILCKNDSIVQTSSSSRQEKIFISSSDMNLLVDENGKSQYSSLHHSVFVSALSSFPNYDLPLCWDQHAKILPAIKDINYKEASKWSSMEVAKFVTDITGQVEYGNTFTSEEIDGDSMLLLKQKDIVEVLKIKLGPAVKIYNAILLIKASQLL